MIFYRSADVPQFDDYRQYRDYLRRDFRYRCAYCLTHEHYFLDGDAGEIDHFRPLKPSVKIGQDFSFLRNVYSNLYWTCGVCNGIKGNKWSTNDEYAQNRRFLDPCEEDHETHWQIEIDGTVMALTSVGEYTIQNLRLNRLTLRRHRQWLLDVQQRVLRLKQRLNRDEIPDELRTELQDYLQTLQQMIEPPVFAS